MNVQPSNGYISNQKVHPSKLNSLQKILKLNKYNQQKLASLLQSIKKRKKQLQQLGVGLYLRENNMPAFDQGFIFNAGVKPIPLENQLSLKKAKSTDFKFTRNIIGEPHQRKVKKIGHLNPLKLSKNPKFINFVEEAEKCTNYETGLEVYKAWRLCNIPKRVVSKTFAKEGILLLIAKKKNYGDNWQKICTFFNGYTFQDLYYFYQKNLTNIKPGRWTLYENIILIILTECLGYGKWAAISKIMKVKSQFQVRQRFCNILDPSITHNKWQKDDALLLKNIAQQHEYEWSKIVKKVPEFKGKTDNALRRKFRTILCKESDEYIKQFVKKKQLANSIIAFKNKQNLRVRKVQ